MSLAGRLAPSVILISLCASFMLFSIPQTARGEVACTKGASRPATAADIETMKAAGIPNPTVGEEYCPDDINAGQNDGQAKLFLRSILCPADGDNYGGMGPDGTIQKLDGKFSICAAKFLKASIAAGINVCIREGARTVEKQNSYVARGVYACKKGAQCEHPRGIAIDVNVKPGANDCSNYTRLHNSAGQFGLTFYLGCKDAYHFVPVKGGCSGGGNIPDDQLLPPTYYDYPQYAPTQPTPPQPLPSSGFSNTVRSALGMTPQTTPTTPATQTQAQSQICTPQFSCTDNTMYYQTTSCTKQIYQTCPYGCGDTSCNLSTSTAATGITVSSVLAGTSSSNTNTNTNTDTTASSTQSVSDILNSYFDPKPVEIGTSSSIAFSLNPDTGEVQQISTENSSTTSLNSAQNTIASIQPVNVQQTFTSGDLGGSQTGYYPAAQTTGLAQVLENMKAALLWALNVLRPFNGGTTNLQFAP